MKRVLSLLIMSLMLVSCDYFEEIKSSYELNGNVSWSGGINYKIRSDNDYLGKILYFSNDCTCCTVITRLTFVNSADEEILVVRSNGPNQLILTREGNNQAIYKLYFEEGVKDSFEMSWDNHTVIEKRHIPDQSLSATIYRNIPRCPY
ncbi:MAG: hypothetical protein GX993_06775 [Bacteroidales bacterium]|nr:hypothetical protein [Bacteroidales bacterium]